MVSSDCEFQVKIKRICDHPRENNPQEHFQGSDFHRVGGRKKSDFHFLAESSQRCPENIMSRERFSYFWRHGRLKIQS